MRHVSKYGPLSQHLCFAIDYVKLGNPPVIEQNMSLKSLARITTFQ